MADKKMWRVAARMETPFPKAPLSLDGHFAVGQMARDYAQSTRLRELRYRVDYVGVLFAGALSHAFKEQPHSSKMRLTALYPVEDDHSSQDLQGSLFGKWEIECVNGPKLKLNVKASTFPEGLAGLMAKVINQHGNERQGWAESSILVIDIGGGTAQINVATDGAVNTTASARLQQGIRGVLNVFERELRHEYADLFKDTMTIPTKRLRTAFYTGTYTGVGTELDVSGIANLAANPFLNALRAVIQSEIGSAMIFDRILVTGGGGGLLYHRLPEVLGTDRIRLVHDLEDIHFANAIGGRKMWLAYEAAM